MKFHTEFTECLDSQGRYTGWAWNLTATEIPGAPSHWEHWVGTGQALTKWGARRQARYRASLYKRNLSRTKRRDSETFSL